MGGFLWEETGSLDSTFYLMGSVMAAGTTFPLLLPVALDKKSNTEEEEDVEKK